MSADNAVEVLSAHLSAGHRIVPEHISKQLFQQCGLTIPRSKVALSPDDVSAAARAVGFPVALKALSPDILHKTELQAVRTNLDSAGVVLEAAREMAEFLGTKPDIRLEGFLVEEMVSPGVELIIGLQNDPQFGPVIMLGIGGIFTEILRDVVFRMLPLTPEDALSMLRSLRGREVLHGYRGGPQVSEQHVVEVLCKVGGFGLEAAAAYESVDLNPIVFSGDRHCILDAKILLSTSATAPTSTAEPNTTHLEHFFAPTGVAHVGASATAGKIGNVVLDSLTQHEFRGQVYPVNPARDEILGVRTYPNLDAIEDAYDLVVVTIALEQTPEVLRQAAAHGARAMLIVSAGGKELGEERADVEEEIRLLAQELDVRIIGPNCIGVFNAENRFDAFFQSHERMVRPGVGPLSFISQSGTFSASFVEDLATVGVSKMVSYGNRVDVDEADLIAYLGNDEATTVIGCYVEGLEDGRKFARTAAKVSRERRKPVVVWKSGRTVSGARAAFSHTGFFGGTYAVYEGAFNQAGLVTVDSYQELIAVCKALAWQPAADGNRVAMVSNGAGPMVTGIDLCGRYGLEVAELAEETERALSEELPFFYITKNPVDVTGSATAADYRLVIDALLQDPNVDIVMPWFVFQDTPLEESIIGYLVELQSQNQRRKPILCGAIGGPYTVTMSAALEAERIPMYGSIDDWISAGGGLARWGSTLSGLP